MFLSDLSLVCEQSRLHADSNFKTVKVTDSDLAYRFYLYFVKNHLADIFSRAGTCFVM